MRKLLFLLVVGALTLAACGGGEANAGDPSRGKTLYDQSLVGANSAPGCKTCHTVDGTRLVGPSFQGVATQAEQIIKAPNYSGSAKTVADYFRESITSPNTYVVEGFTPDLMYQNYAKDLSDQEVTDLVAYLATLK